MIIWKGDKLRIDASLLKKCFEEPVTEVISCVENLLSNWSMRKVSKIILVGGFSESLYVQESFRASFADKQIIIPPECGIAVLKGAVLFGHNPSVVTARIARYTYDLDIAVPFDHKKHPKENLLNTDAGQLCLHSFWKAVVIGQEIKTDHEVKRTGRAADDFQSKLILHVVKSNQQDPIFTTDKGCEGIGKIDVPMDSTLKADNNVVEEMLKFGGTELKVRTKHKILGDIHELNIDL